MNVINIDCNILKSWVDAGEAVIIDTRSNDQYAAESIEGAINICGVTANQLEDFAGKKIVFQCNRGGGSARAANAIIGDMSQDIYNLAGGIADWKKAGYPIK